MTRVKLASDLDILARITRLRRWIRKRSPIGKWFALRDADPQSGTAQSLLNAVSRSWSGSPVARAAGYYALSGMSLTIGERNQLTAILEHELGPCSTADVLAAILVRAPIFLICTYFALVALYGACMYSPPPYNPEDIDATTKADIIVPLILGVACTSPLWYARKWKRIVEHAAVVAICRHGGPECIAALHRHMNVSVSLRADASSAMRKLLLLVDEAWYGRLPQDSQFVLVCLAGSGDEELSHSALNAISRAGDGTAAGEVLRLAHFAPNESARQLAAEILPGLLARKANEESSSLLLRASHGVETHVLLRPASDALPISMELLRESVQDNSAT